MVHSGRFSARFLDETGIFRLTLLLNRESQNREFENRKAKEFLNLSKPIYTKTYLRKNFEEVAPQIDQVEDCKKFSLTFEEKNYFDIHIINRPMKKLLVITALAMFAGCVNQTETERKQSVISSAADTVHAPVSGSDSIINHYAPGCYGIPHYMTDIKSSCRHNALNPEIQVEGRQEQLTSR